MKRKPTTPAEPALEPGVYRVVNGISFPAPTDEDPRAERYRAVGETVRADELTPDALAEYVRHGDLEAPAASGPTVDEALNPPAVAPATEE